MPTSRDDSDSPLLDFGPAASEFELTDLGACEFLHGREQPLRPERSLTEQIDVICDVSGASKAGESCAGDASDIPCAPSPSSGPVPAIPRPPSPRDALDAARRRKRRAPDGPSGPGVRLVEPSGPRPTARAPLPLPGRAARADVRRSTRGEQTRVGRVTSAQDVVEVPPPITGNQPLPSPVRRRRESRDNARVPAAGRQQASGDGPLAAPASPRHEVSPAPQSARPPTSPPPVAAPAPPPAPATPDDTRAREPGASPPAPAARAGQGHPGRPDARSDIDPLDLALDEFTGRTADDFARKPATDVEHSFGGYFDPAERAAEMERLKKERASSTRTTSPDTRPEIFGWDVDDIDQADPPVPRSGIVRHRRSRSGEKPAQATAGHEQVPPSAEPTPSDSNDGSDSGDD